MAPSVGQMKVKLELHFPKPCLEGGKEAQVIWLMFLRKQNGELHSFVVRITADAPTAPWPWSGAEGVDCVQQTPSQASPLLLEAFWLF